ncbi:MAG: hypothetical protein RBT37_06265 [Dissulfurispiraceae bacterium]|jgi:hypothetical protein|nr:hypothetical protein [Dissulfurispiraceae bacterium]
MKRSLLAALFLIALGGFLLHYRIHHFMIPDPLNPENLIFSKTLFLASLLPLIDMFVVTSLFIWRRTAAYGYLLNGLIVIYGSILMTHYSIAQFSIKAIPLSDWWLKSTLPDIAILCADFLIGKTLYDIHTGKIKNQD